MALTRSEFDGGMWSIACPDGFGSVTNATHKWAHAVNLAAGQPSRQPKSEIELLKIDQFVHGLAKMAPAQRARETNAYLRAQSDPALATSALLERTWNHAESTVKAIFDGYLGLQGSAKAPVGFDVALKFLNQNESLHPKKLAVCIGILVERSPKLDLTKLVTELAKSGQDPTAACHYLAKAAFGRLRFADIDTQTAMLKNVMQMMLRGIKDSDASLMEWVIITYASAQRQINPSADVAILIEDLIAADYGADTEAVRKKLVDVYIRHHAGSPLDRKEAEEAGNRLVSRTWGVDAKDAEIDTTIGERLLLKFVIDVDPVRWNGVAGPDPDGTP